MENSICPRCGKNKFEIKAYKPIDTDYKVDFVQCSYCGSVIGIITSHHMKMLFDDLGQKIARLFDEINIVKQRIDNTNRTIRRKF